MLIRKGSRTDQRKKTEQSSAVQSRADNRVLRTEAQMGSGLTEGREQNRVETE
jgi:hypothetical protein